MRLSQQKPFLSTESLSSTQIIVQDLQRHGYTGDIKEHLASILTCVNNKRGVLLRFSNTVFFGALVEPCVFSVHLYTVDSTRAMAGAINAAIDTAKYAGIKRLCASTKEEKIIKMLIRMGYPVEVKQDGDTFSWTMEIKSEI
jgi:hypothetical protein